MARYGENVLGYLQFKPNGEPIGITPEDIHAHGVLPALQQAQEHIVKNWPLREPAILQQQQQQQTQKGEWKDELPGGLADDKKPSDFPADKVAAGVREEMREHTNDKHIATEIVMDHLTENPSEYDEELSKAEARPIAPTDTTPSDPEYVYHGTNAERAQSIATEGLSVHKPWEFTDQNTWPDGSTQKRSYHSPSVKGVMPFLPEDRGGGYVVLRTHRSQHPFRTEGTGDLYSTTPIAPHKIEILTEQGWHPLAAATEKAEVGPSGYHPKLRWPVGSVHNGKVKINHGEGGSGWVSVRSGQVLSQDGHSISAKNPSGR